MTSMGWRALSKETSDCRKEIKIFATIKDLKWEENTYS